MELHFSTLSCFIQASTYLFLLNPFPHIYLFAMSARSPQRRPSITSHRESGRARSSSLHRSVSPRSDTRGRSVTRSPSYERDSNGAHLRNRSFSRSRPMSRGRSPSRGRGRGYRSRSRSYSPIRADSPPRSSKVCSVANSFSPSPVSLVSLLQPHLLG